MELRNRPANIQTYKCEYEFAVMNGYEIAVMRFENINLQERIKSMSAYISISILKFPIISCISKVDPKNGGSVENFITFDELYSSSTYDYDLMNRKRKIEANKRNFLPNEAWKSLVT